MNHLRVSADNNDVHRCVDTFGCGGGHGVVDLVYITFLWKPFSARLRMEESDRVSQIKTSKTDTQTNGRHDNRAILARVIRQISGRRMPLG